jgi:hypothetical protein
MEQRTINELLILLRDNVDVMVIKTWYGSKKRIISGFCHDIWYIPDISIEEYIIVFKYIDKNRPRWHRCGAYGWKPKLWKPRLKWLNMHIELIKADNV